MKINPNDKAPMSKQILQDVKLKPRLTRILTMHYETPDDRPVTVESRTQTESDSEDQSFQKHVNLTDQWVAIDSGWIDKPSTITLLARKPKHTLVPPREIREAEEDMVVELAYAMPGQSPSDEKVIPLFEFPLGHLQDFCPKNHKILRIRVNQGSAKCVVTCLP